MENTEGRITPGTSMSVFVLMSTLFLGVVLFVIGYIVSRLSNRSSDSTKNTTESEKVKFDYSKDSASGSAATASSGSNKRAKNKKRREAQQEFTHSWLRGALKGHTSSVLNMNFSSNGKYLASCAEGKYQHQCIKENSSGERSLSVTVLLLVKLILRATSLSDEARSTSSS
ncbi:hypothetical protein K0M31_005253 [Melipona bicolor]|uniref:Uncharacterized protein n=1 Tax=Melipona bicolor TaxID=60889 RepID=A0AA40FUN7_9HYME|nr:hypothetical protein K0M31_005253 [Melipona bicolor]